MKRWAFLSTGALVIYRMTEDELMATNRTIKGIAFLSINDLIVKGQTVEITINEQGITFCIDVAHIKGLFTDVKSKIGDCLGEVLTSFEKNGALLLQLKHFYMPTKEDTTRKNIAQSYLLDLIQYVQKQMDFTGQSDITQADFTRDQESFICDCFDVMVRKVWPSTTCIKTTRPYVVTPGNSLEYFTPIHVVDAMKQYDVDNLKIFGKVKEDGIVMPKFPPHWRFVGKATRQEEQRIYIPTEHMENPGPNERSRATCRSHVETQKTSLMGTLSYSGIGTFKLNVKLCAGK